MEWRSSLAEGRLRKNRHGDGMVNERCIEAVCSSNNKPLLIAIQWHAEAYDPYSPQACILLRVVSYLLSRPAMEDTRGDTDNAVEDVLPPFADLKVATSVSRRTGRSAPTDLRPQTRAGEVVSTGIMT